MTPREPGGCRATGQRGCLSSAAEMTASPVGAAERPGLEAAQEPSAFPGGRGLPWWAWPLVRAGGRGDASPLQRRALQSRADLYVGRFSPLFVLHLSISAASQPRRRQTGPVLKYQRLRLLRRTEASLLAPTCLNPERRRSKDVSPQRFYSVCGIKLLNGRGPVWLLSHSAPNSHQLSAPLSFSYLALFSLPASPAPLHTHTPLTEE